MGMGGMILMVNKLKRKAMIEARDHALLSHGYLGDWSPRNGEPAYYANICGKCDSPIIERVAIKVEADDPDLMIYTSTIDVKCPCCGAAIALRAFPTYQVAQDFIKKYYEDLRRLMKC